MGKIGQPQNLPLAWVSVGTSEKGELTMAGFEEDGFLTDDVPWLRRAVGETCCNLLDTCIQLNRSAQCLQYSLKINSDSLPEVLSAALYVRVLSTFQGSLLLAQRGMGVQVAMMMRCVLEAVFPLVAISQDAEFANEFVLAESHERLKAARRVRRYKERAGDQSGLDECLEVESEAKNDIDDSDVRELRTIDCAKRAGLLDYYDTLYCYSSLSIHCSPRSLEQCLVFDSTVSRVTAIVNEPSAAKLEEFLVTLGHLVDMAATAVCTVFKMDKPANLVCLAQQLDLHAGGLV